MATKPKDPAFAAGWKHAKEKRAFWEAHWQELLVTYPNQSVAVKDGKVIAADADLDAFLAKMETLGYPPTEVWPDIWLRYVDASPVTTY